MTESPEAPRCQVMVEGRAGVCPEHFSYCSHDYEGICGLPLEPTGGPCVTCGGDDNMMIHSPYWAEGRPAGHSGHPYVSPQSCPVHGAATDGGEA